MRRVREVRGGRWRRPAGAAAALAVLAVLLPVAPATAAADGLSPDRPEVTGETITYSFECTYTATEGPSWILREDTEYFLVDAGMVETYTASDGYMEGTFQVDFTNRAPGPYSVMVQCGSAGSAVPQRAFELGGPAKSTTSVTLSASAPQVVLGSPVSLTAVVDGTESGEVEFLADGQWFATADVVDGRATTTRTPARAETLTARFLGTETAQASLVSNSVLVAVVTDITAPETVGTTATPTVGVPVSAAVGEWGPAGVALSYVWEVGGEEVSTDPTYLPVGADYGKPITVSVTGTRAPLTPVTRTSTPVAVAPGTIQMGDLTVDGLTEDRAVVGQVLTPRPAGFGSDASFSYEWWVGDNDFSIAGDTYTPTVADLGKQIRVRATVTATGKSPDWTAAWILPAVAEPTVAVGSSTITVGRDAVVPVTVSGPVGGPVAEGSVEVTVTPDGSATPAHATTVELVDGAASVTVPGLGVGGYAVVVRYLPDGEHLPSFARSSVSLAPYTEAAGSGTVTVTKATPAVSAPSSVSVAVATPARFPVTVTGSALPQQYVVREGSTVLAQGEVGSDGRIGVELPVLTPGTHTVTLELPATKTTTAVTRTVTVTVTGEPARETLVPTADLGSPEKATAPGQEMVLVAEGFEPGETVAFYLHSEPVFLGTAVAGADGVARLTATIPADVPAGAHTVYATGGTSGRWASLAVELATPAAAPAATPAATPAAPVTPAATAADELATTGASGGLAAAAAWALLLVGGGLVVLARRARIAR